MISQSCVNTKIPKKPTKTPTKNNIKIIIKKPTHNKPSLKNTLKFTIPHPSMRVSIFK